MNSIQEVVNAKVLEMIEGGAIQKKIEESIQQSIETAIDIQFRSYGSITKQIEKVFEDGLKINTKNIEFDSYNQVMLSAVKMKLNQYFAEESSSKFILQLDEMFQPAPKEIDVHDFVNQIVKYWKDDNESYNDWEDYANAEWNSERSHLKIWVNETGYRSSKAKEVELYIRDEQIRISHRMQYNPTALFGDDALIFRLYSAGTKIVGVQDFDSDNCDLDVSLDEGY